MERNLYALHDLTQHIRTNAHKKNTVPSHGTRTTRR